MSELNRIAKELQEYVNMVGSRNTHIQSVANRLVELTEPQLNENQQIVFDWMKKKYKGKYLFPIECTWLLLRNFANGYLESEEERAFENLNKLQEVQVLQVFASWVLEQEEE